MRARKDKHTDEITKKAWAQNWDSVPLSRIMEIFEYPRVKENVELFLSCLPKGKKILEGGCGLAPYVIHLKRMGYDIIGVDYNEEPLKRAREFEKDLDLRCGNVEELPFSDGYFGGYLSLGVIEHFTEGPEKAIREAARVLETGGVFVVKVPRTTIFERISFPLTMLKKNKTIRKFLGKSPGEDHYWEQRFETEELRALLEKAGFEVGRIVPVDQEHGLLAFSSIFRSKDTYDGPNELCLSLTRWCKRFIPWLAAPGVVFICRKAA